MTTPRAPEELVRAPEPECVALLCADPNLRAAVVRDLADVELALASTVEELEEQLRRCKVDVALIAPDALEHTRDVRETESRLFLIALTDDAERAPELRLAGADLVHAYPGPPPVLRSHLELGRVVCAERWRAAAYLLAVDGSTDMVEITGPDILLQHVNPEFERATLFSAQDALGRTPGSLLRSPVHDADLYRQLWEVLSSGQEWVGALAERRRDGSPLNVLARLTSLLDSQGHIRHFVAVKQHIPWATSSADAPSDMTRAEHDPGALKRLVHSEQRYREMVCAANHAILVADFATARFVDANPAALSMFGYSMDELRVMTGRALSPADSGAAVDAVALELRGTGRIVVERMPLQRKDGSHFWATMSGSRYESAKDGHSFHVMFLRDVTADIERDDQLEAAREQMTRSARLAAVGQLAAGVAHEINNPLQFVIGSLARLGASLEGDELICLGDAREGASRIASIARSLLPFARADRGEAELVDLEDVALWAHRMTHNEVRHHARFTLELDFDASRPLTAHRAKLGQLLTNLLLNATHALAERHAADHVVTLGGESGEEAARLWVEDTGRGISAADQERIFEPFFTTRSASGGTGLGLALCMDIVDAHQGTIEVLSEVDRGTRFTVTLPYDNGLVSMTPAAPPQDTSGDVPPSRRARVLLIDDEPQIVKVYEFMLEDDFDCESATSAREALDRLAHDTRFDAIVCDLMMPTMDGPEFYEALGALAPALQERVLFCSGGAFTARTLEFVSTLTHPLLQKPIRVEALREAVALVVASTAEAQY